MRIGIDVSRANKAQKTGVEWYSYFLVEEMKKLAAEYNLDDVILYSDSELVGDLAILPTGWKSKVLSWPPKRLWTKFRFSIEMLLHPPDILFIPAHVPPTIRPKNTVITIHDIAAARFPTSYNRFERWYSVFTAKRSVTTLRSVIVPSLFTKTELTAVAGVGEADIHVIHHGYHLDKFTTQADDLLVDIKKPYLLYVGRIEEKKNTKRLVKAYNSLRDKGYNYKLVLVGKPGYGYEAVKLAINTSAYKNDIIMPGWVSPGQLSSLYQNAALFVFPTLYEGFGLPVLEAFASRIPVIAATGSCLQEIAAEAAIYVNPLSVESIATHMIQVIDNPSLQQQLVEAGEKRLKQFSWEKTARETIAVLLK